MKTMLALLWVLLTKTVVEGLLLLLLCVLVIKIGARLLVLN